MAALRGFALFSDKPAPFSDKKPSAVRKLSGFPGNSPAFTDAAVLLLSLSVCLFSPAVPLAAFPGDTDVLNAEFWTELDPIPLAGDKLPVSQETAVSRVLEEARIVISGMMYGYKVIYTPSDRARKVSEQLEVIPLATIPKGDPALRATDVRMEKNRYYVRIRYDLTEYQIRRLEAWNSNILESAAGRGTAPVQEGYRGKFESFNQGIKNALREYLRKRVGNKPREITAMVALQAPPYTTIDAGGYHSLVRVRIDLRNVRPYGAY